MTPFDIQTAFSNATSISIPALGSATPYPSNILVSGLTGTITKVTVTLSGFSHTAPDDVDVLLVGPGGQKFIVMSDAGGTATPVSNLNLTFDDAAGSLLPDNTTFGSGTFKPTDYGTGDTFAAPAPAGPYNEPATQGTATFASVFNGTGPNGTWSLYVVDDTGGDSGSFSGGWSIDITTAGAALATTTIVTSNNNPSFATAPNNSVTFTATVTSSSTVNSGTVTFTDGATTLASNVPVNGSGVAATTTSALTTEGDHVITATYNGNASFATSNGSITQVVNNHTVITGNQYCNPGAITIPLSGSASPYPSNIFLTGVSGVVSTVTLKLNGFTHTSPDDVDVLLVGPGGQKFIPMSDAGGGNAVSGITFTLDDTAGSALPDASALSSGTFKPASYSPTDTFGAPAPAGPYNEAAPGGASTFGSVFTGINPNGTWAIYVSDDTGGDSGTISGGPCLTITTAGLTPTTTTVASNLNPSFTGDAVTFTATVASGGPVTTGTVTFTEGAATLASNVPVNGSGQAQFTTNALTEGTHTITATYSGTVTFGVSNGSVSQEVNNHTVVVGNTFTNPGGIAIPALGASNPYPSKVFVTGLGSVCKVTLKLNGFTHTSPDDVDILLVGPGGQKFVVMSDTGGTNSVSGLNITLDDAGASLLPDATALTTGTFKPTDYGAESSFPAPAPGTPYNEPGTAGAATFSSVFSGANANGTWSLYVADDTGSDSGTIASGWTLTITSVGITPTTLPGSVFGQAYTPTLTGTGGTGPYTFGIVSGSIPTGTNLSTAGVFSGNTTAVGLFNFDVSVTPASGCPASTFSYSVNVVKANSTTTVTSSQNPSIAGQSVTFTANVSVSAPGSGTPTGTVQFLDGGNPLGSPVSLSGGSAQLSTSGLTVGSHTITAQYNGDTNVNTSSGSMTGNPQVVTNTATWNGAASTSWTTAGNWVTGAVPGSTNDVSIPAAGVTNEPTISTAVTLASITEATGRTLTVSSAGNLAVTGACTVNGTANIAGTASCGSVAGTGTVNFTGTAVQNVPGGTYQNLGVTNAAGINLSASVTVNGVLNLGGGDLNTGANVLTIGTTGTVTRTSGAVIGPVQKLFGGPGAFTYPVGTAGAFSPVDANVTAGAGQLTVTAKTGTAPATTPPLVPANTLQRYWDLNGSGITVDVTWHYLQTDVNGTEANYRIIRVVSSGAAISVPNGSPCPGTGSPCVDTTNNTIFAKGLTSFSLWTAGANVVTAAKVAITGRVVRPDGLMAVRSLVSMTDDHGNVRYAKTNPFGYFRFQDVESGQGDVINVIDKQFEFAPQFVSVTANMGDLVLALQPRP